MSEGHDEEQEPCPKCGQPMRLTANDGCVADNCIRDRVGKFVVRVYDGMDNQWCDCTGPLSKDDAMAEWNRLTEKGTVKYHFDHIDYYRVFPADSRMLYSGGFGERR